jgi:anti-sigma regulatory factor (Ser/Thr protein kinase)
MEVSTGGDRPMGGPSATLWRVDDASQVGEVRRAAATLAGEAGLGEAERGTLAVVVTELATNLAAHATGGRVLLRAIGEPGAGGVEALAIDDGPGIANPERAQEDGYSTAGTAGKGLGAIARMADEFDLYSRAGVGPGIGTTLVARVWSAGARAAAARTTHDPTTTTSALPALRTGVVCVPVAGETACGDAWLVIPRGDVLLVVVVDGLGHGDSAAVAADEAARAIRASRETSPSALVHAAHGPLRATRGAALAVAAIQPDRGTLAFAGIGNISAAVHTVDGARSLASHNGTVGHAMRTVQEFTYEWPARATLVMHSDGINTRWRLDGYPGLLHYDPSLLAATLYRDAARGRDDATVVAVREAAP